MKYQLHRLGIEALNTMQEEMLQQARRHDNMVLLSPTGSGKTLAYLLPVLEALESRDGVQVLVLVPNRELAVQTRDVVQTLCPEARPFACYGGRPTMEEHRAMQGNPPILVVGTPGRILDHIGKGNFSVGNINTLVIDEFDKSLELGFRQQMSDILGQLPSLRRRILLSATNSPDIPNFVGMSDTLCLDYRSDEGDDYTKRIRQFVVHSPEKDKLRTLDHLLCSLGSASSIVFLNYRKSVDRVLSYLEGRGFCVTAFHGGMDQKDRERALFRFQSGSANVLVCTDLAARGLDLLIVENIIHYHLPLRLEDYVHRNGRTARWDREGTSYAILGLGETLDRLNGLPEAESFDVPEDSTVPGSRWETLYIARGKGDKVNKVDIVGFLIKTGGLQSSQLGMVKVLPRWSFAAVDRTCLKTLMNNIAGQKIKGQKTIFEVFRK